MEFSELLKLKISNFLKFSAFQKSRIYKLRNVQFFYIIIFKYPRFLSHIFDFLISQLFQVFFFFQTVCKINLNLFPCMFSLQGFSPGAPTSCLNLKVVAASRQNAEPQQDPTDTWSWNSSDGTQKNRSKRSWWMQEVVASSGGCQGNQKLDVIKAVWRLLPKLDIFLIYFFPGFAVSFAECCLWVSDHFRLKMTAGLAWGWS